MQDKHTGADGMAEIVAFHNAAVSDNAFIESEVRSDINDYFGTGDVGIDLAAREQAGGSDQARKGTDAVHATILAV